jgi:hypothetical protein
LERFFISAKDAVENLLANWFRIQSGDAIANLSEDHREKILSKAEQLSLVIP